MNGKKHAILVQFSKVYQKSKQKSKQTQQFVLNKYLIDYLLRPYVLRWYFIDEAPFQLKLIDKTHA